MNKAILMSIQPQHAVNILKGKKTLELRKTVPKNFKGWVYIYVTKGKPYLGKNHDGNIGLYNIPAFGHYNKSGDLNGKVVARFWFDEYAEIKLNVYTSLSTTYFESFNSWDNVPYEEQSGVIDSNYLEDITQVSFPDMKAYAKGKTLYAWHIKKLEIFDEPLSLNDFYRQLPYPNNVNVSPLICGEESLDDRYLECIKGFEIKRPPQSWQYVYRKKE